MSLFCRELSSRLGQTSTLLIGFGRSSVHQMQKRDSSIQLARGDFFRKGCWIEKETLAEYLKCRVTSLDAYMATLKSAPTDRTLMEKIRREYETRVPEDDETIFAVRSVSERGCATYENSGSSFLKKREIQFYLKNGLIGPMKIGTISQDTIQAVFSRYIDILKTLSPQEYREARVRQEWQNKDILKLACNPEIISKVSSLLGSNIKIRFTGIHEVPPGIGSFSSITDGKIAALCAHSDTNLAARLSKRGLTGPFVDLDSINVWISISGTDPYNAPLYVFPRTHKWPVLNPLRYLNHAKREKIVFERTLKLLSMTGFGNEMIANHLLCYGYLQTSSYQDELLKIRRTEIYTNPGDCLIFTSHLMHGSDTNLTLKSRLGISIRYSSAMNGENDDNLKAVHEIFSSKERQQLGLTDGDNRSPIIQVLGTKHHEKSKPIDLNQLDIILSNKPR